MPEKLSTSASVRFIALPVQRTHSWRYDLLIDAAEQMTSTDPVKARVYCFRDCPQDIHPESRYRVNLYLEKYHFPRNPSNFDYQGWLERNRFVYGGKLFASSLELIEESRISLHSRVVSYLIEQFRSHEYSHQYLALVTGLRGFLSPEDKDTLRHTGTMHLLVVSGLHMGFVFVLVFALVRLFVPFSPLWPGLAGLSAMLAYAWLAGFSLPSQRALIMSTMACLWFFPGHRFHPWYIWLTALILVLVINRPYVFDAGLFLSFGTVALLLMTFYRQHRNTSWWRSLLISQWYIFPGLCVLQLIFFNSFSLIALVANLIAIPATGFVILPLLLLGCLFLFVFPPVGQLILDLLDPVFGLLWQVLLLLKQINWAHIEVAGERMTTPIVLVLAVLFVFVHLLPRTSPGKLVALLLVPLLLLDLRTQSKPTIWVFASRDHVHMLYREGHYGLVISNAYEDPVRLPSIRYSILPSLRYFDITTVDWMSIHQPLAIKADEIQQHLRRDQQLRLLPKCTLPDTPLTVHLKIQRQSDDCLVTIQNQAGSLLFVPNRYSTSDVIGLTGQKTYLLGLHPDDLTPLVSQIPDRQKPTCILPSYGDVQLADVCTVVTTRTDAVHITLGDWSWYND